MKQAVWISIVIFCALFICLCVCKSSKILDIENKSDPQASKVLYDYVMANLDDSSKSFAEITTGRTHALNIDLNNDGVDEVIGVVLSPYYCNSENCSLFILQKQDNKYENIVSDINFRGKIRVKRNLTNGFKDIELFVPDLKSGLQFKNGKYDWAYQIKGICQKFYSQRILDFTKEPDLNAGKILYDFILKESGYSEEEFLKLAFTIRPEAAIAHEVDLNDDGVNEIIGFFNSTYNMGTYGYSLYILQKQNDEFVDISGMLHLEPQYNIYILKHKTNGFKDIKFTGSVGYNFRSFVVPFKKGSYQF